MESSLSNVTHVHLFWTDPYSFLDGLIVAKVFINVLYTTNLLTGTVFYLGIIYHEKYGEDPQKRGVLNQVLYFY